MKLKKSLMIVPGSKYFENLLEASFRGPTSTKLWGPKVDFHNILYTWVNCPSFFMAYKNKYHPVFTTKCGCCLI